MCFPCPSGDVYYANHDQAVTQWTHPRTGQRKAVSDKLPFGWERKILEYNKASISVEDN